MSENRKSLNENNSFFDGEYKEYTKNSSKDSCATGTLTLNDLHTMYDMENTSMLKDYETSQLRLSDQVRKRREETDRKIGELTGSPSPEPLSNYIFDADEVTVGDLVAIDEELQHQKDLLEEEPKEPYLSGLIAVSPGEPTEKIAVISVPSEAIISDESPFIAVEDL